jgi:hypothetical protein
MSIAAHRAPATPVLCCCSCSGGHGNRVNIYVNNNVQGVTNSMLVAEVELEQVREGVFVL